MLPIGILPTNRDILKEVLYKRSLPENSRTLDQMSLVSCNFLKFDSKCYQDDEGCSNKSEDQKCTLEGSQKE